MPTNVGLDTCVSLICPDSNHEVHVISQSSVFIEEIRSQFCLRRRVMPISSEERLRATRQTQTPYHRARMKFVENHLQESDDTKAQEAIMKGISKAAHAGLSPLIPAVLAPP